MEDGHDRGSAATSDQLVGGRPAKRRKIHGEESSSDRDVASRDNDEHEWHFGVDHDDEDSDLDSDAAMGDGDEEKFEGFAFRGSSALSSKKPPRTRALHGSRKAKDIDLQESSQQASSLDFESDSADDDGVGEGAVDLATALDMNEESEGEKDKVQKNSSRPRHKRLRDAQNTSDSNGSSDDETSASGDADSALSFSDDEDSIANHARLTSFVQGLEGATPSNVPSKRSRPPAAVGEPSDYGLASSRKLTIADLLPTVTDRRLRESLKMLHNSEQKGSKISTRGIPGKLDPPLPKRQQDRLDREAAYEKSKDTLSRWIDTVKRNRRAEHILFPLPNPDALAALGTNQLMPISQLEAVTPLEFAIQSIMHESGLASKTDVLTEEKMQAFEGLQEKKIPIEEVQIRRAELRKARDLMFREEVRARRIHKIKSKAYRRVHRKERDKHAQQERAALVASGALDSEDERERQDRQRAEERMGARHKESRWAKGMRATGRAVWDDDARLGINDLARKDDELRNRINGKEPHRSGGSLTESSGSESSDDISVDEYDEVEGLKLKQKLGELETAGQSNHSDSRLASMPFMRKAESARQAANKADIDRTRRILEGEDSEAEGEDKSMAETEGRRKFGLRQQGQNERPSRAEEENEFEELLTEEETKEVSPSKGRMLDPVQKPLPQKMVNARKTILHSDNHVSANNVPSDTKNPWLSGPRNRMSNYVTEGAIISTEAALQVDRPSTDHSQKRQLTSKTRIVRQPTMEDLTSPSDSEEEACDKPAVHKQSSRRNEELVRMAFAGDDVFQAFADEKKATMDEEGDQVVDTSLPGWGSWTGAGISKKEERRAVARKTTTTIKGIDPSKRKDAKLDRVIINEKRSKKVMKHPL